MSEDKQERRTRLDSFRRSIASVQAYRDSLRATVSSGESDIKNLRYRAELNQSSSEIFKKWLEDSLRVNVDSMSELATNGLRHVIQDQELTFKIKQELKHNRLSMRFVLEEDGVEADPMTSFGGGAVHIISLILRLSVMTRLGMGNVLILDEAMNALAEKYIPAASDFMKRLSEETGIHILMVTHNDEFMTNAHTAYEATTVRGDDGLKSVKLKRRVR